MGKDFGTRAPQRAPLGPWVVGILALGSAALLAHYLLNKGLNERIADASAWTVTGPPCPTMSKEAFAAQPYEARQSFETNGIRWARSSATVMCQSIASDGGRGGEVYPVCQFSAPRVLQITTPRGDFYFAPGLGKKATVTVRHDVAQCVMGASVDFRN